MSESDNVLIVKEITRSQPHKGSELMVHMHFSRISWLNTPYASILRESHNYYIQADQPKPIIEPIKP